MVGTSNKSLPAAWPLIECVGAAFPDPKRVKQKMKHTETKTCLLKETSKQLWDDPWNNQPGKIHGQPTKL